MQFDGEMAQSITSANVYEFTRIANLFNDRVIILKGTNIGNPKSLLSVLSLSLCRGDKVSIIINTKDRYITSTWVSQTFSPFLSSLTLVKEEADEN